MYRNKKEKKNILPGFPILEGFFFHWGTVFFFYFLFFFCRYFVVAGFIACLGSFFKKLCFLDFDTDEALNELERLGPLPSSAQSSVNGGSMDPLSQQPPSVHAVSWLLH